MSGPRVGVLALQGDVREHRRILESLGAVVIAVRRPAELEQLDALVVPGGESTTIAKLARSFGLMDPLRERIKGGLPTFGSCAGMVLLAREVVDGTADQEVVGALDIVVRRNAFGRQVDSFESELEVHGLDRPVHAVFIRAPWVESTGPDVEVLASVNGHPVAVRQGALLATSFHPELGDDDRMHRLLLDAIR